MRFGILCDAPDLARWQFECLEQLLAVPGVELEVVLELRSEPSAASRLFRRLDAIEPAGPRARVAFPPAMAGLRSVPVSAPADAAQVRSLRLDFILDFSSVAPAPVRGELAAHGVWRLEFGDWVEYRGGPPGFWEVYDRAPLSGCVLARLTAEADVIIPLRRGYLNTRFQSYSQNRDQLLRRFVHWPAQVCSEIQRGVLTSLAQAPLRSRAAVRGTPDDARVLRFGVRRAGPAVTRGLSSLLQSDHWNIGIVQQSIADFLDPAKPRLPVRWMPVRRAGEFIADPFAVVRAGRLTVFCEFLDYRDGVGRIVAFDPDVPDDLAAVRIGPDPPVHLSYPWVFEHEGRLFCIPETSGAREVALYELESFPARWRKVVTLLQGRAVVDATVFRWGEYWWMTAATDAAGVGVGSELNAWFASDLLGPWHAHPGNPVKIDVRSARPAGTPFVVDGVLYRPAQDSSRTYGGRVVINRVDALTPAEFSEQPVAFVEPDTDGAYPDGLHTLCAVGDITVIDGKRLKFSLPDFRRMVLRMVRRRLGRLAQRLPWAGTARSGRHNSA